jgi:hypothetical protein
MKRVGGSGSERGSARTPLTILGAVAACVAVVAVGRILERAFPPAAPPATVSPLSRSPSVARGPAPSSPPDAAALPGGPAALPAPSGTAAVALPPAATPSSAEVEDLAASSNPDDWQKAREILEPRVYAQRGKPAEARLLKKICLQQGDRTCAEACDSVLGDMRRR